MRILSRWHVFVNSSCLIDMLYIVQIKYRLKAVDPELAVSEVRASHMLYKEHI